MTVKELIGRIGEKIIILNEFEEVSAFFCIQGNTNCILVTVYENDEQAYSRKAFLSETQRFLVNTVQDLEYMIAHKQKEHAAKHLREENEK